MPDRRTVRADASGDEPASGNDLGFSLPIFDAHHHFWRLGEGHYPWLSDAYDSTFFLGDYRSICTDFMVDEYAAATAGFDVVGSVHVEAERSRKEQVAETEFLTRLNRETGRPNAIVGHVYFTQPDREAVLAGHAAHGLVRGIRSKPKTAPRPDASVDGDAGSMQDPNWLAGYALLARYGFSWDLRVPYWELERAAAVVSRFPDIPVVVNHLGLPVDRTVDGLAMWRRGMAALAACPHVTVKVSQLGLAGARWDPASNRRVVREAVELFGYSRSMFGSNLPVAGLAASFRDGVSDILAALHDATEADLKQVFSETARMFYRVG